LKAIKGNVCQQSWLRSPLDVLSDWQLPGLQTAIIH